MSLTITQHLKKNAAEITLKILIKFDLINADKPLSKFALNHQFLDPASS